MFSLIVLRIFEGDFRYVGCFPFPLHSDSATFSNGRFRHGTTWDTQFLQRKGRAIFLEHCTHIIRFSFKREVAMLGTRSRNFSLPNCLAR